MQTFLFTDIEGSTRLWSRAPVVMAEAVQRQETLLRATIEHHQGAVFKTVGDGVYAVFARPEQAILFTVSAWNAICEQHIPVRYEAGDVEAALAEAGRRVAALEAEVRRLQELTGQT